MAADTHGSARDLTERMAAMIIERHRQQHATRMAGALCISLQIPAGSDLVVHLTARPDVRTNREAVTCWVEDQMEALDHEGGIASFPVLADRLGAQLRRIAEGH